MTHQLDHRASTGIEGLDQLLNGGLPRDELYLIQGGPGTGKTTLGLQFLLEGVRSNEGALYITLSQTERGLRKMAQAHGLSLDGIDIYAFVGAAVNEGAALEQTVFRTAEVELGETVEGMLEAVERHRPRRIVFDSVAELRLLAESSLRYRRQIVALRQFLTGRGCTVLFLDNETSADSSALEGLTNGVVTLQQASPAYGNVRRRLEVVKVRETNFHGGFHDFRILTGGLEIYPRLEPTSDSEHAEWEVLKSGIAELDTLLGGGLELGTAALIMGPAGVGKTTLASFYAYAVAERGERAAIFLFDERPETFYRRSHELGLDMKPLVDSGHILLRQINTGELTAGEFAHIVRQAVEETAIKVVVIDTLTGYVNAMSEEQVLITQMHELLSYLSHRGVLSLLVVAQHGLVGTEVTAPVDVSYMADVVLLLRYFETQGELRKAISVIKKRHGNHEKVIRELHLMPGRVKVGAPIRNFRGVLTGTPSFEGSDQQLLSGDADTSRA